MTLTLVIRKRVTGELNEIYHWYEAERRGLGAEFLNEFASVAKSIQEFPHTFVRVNDRVRRANCDRYPYFVFFRVESKRVIVLMVVHQAPSPNSWPPPRKRRR